MDMQPNEVPSTTPNFQTELANKLAQLCPEIITDGKIDFDTLKTLLNADIAGGGSDSDSSGQVKPKPSAQPKPQPPQH